MSDHVYTMPVNLSLLGEELATASFSGNTIGSTFENGDVTVSSTPDLTAGEVTELDALMAAHVATGYTLEQKIHAARGFGTTMINQYQSAMISEGIIQAGKAHEVAAKLERSLVMAQAGNLYALDDELATVVPTTTYLEQSRIDEMRDAVRAYLGLPPL